MRCTCRTPGDSVHWGWCCARTTGRHGITNAAGQCPHGPPPPPPQKCTHRRPLCLRHKLDAQPGINNLSRKLPASQVLTCVVSHHICAPCLPPLRLPCGCRLVQDSQRVRLAASNTGGVGWGGDGGGCLKRHASVSSSWQVCEVLHSRRKGGQREGNLGVGLARRRAGACPANPPKRLAFVARPDRRCY